MKTPLFLFCSVLFFSVLADPSLALREMKGTVYTLDAHDKKNPATNMTIREEKTKVSNVTTSEGGYRLLLPDDFIPGEPVTLFVESETFRIWRPFDGEVRIPATPTKDPVDVILVKKGSHRFLSDDDLKRRIQKIAEETGKQNLSEEENKKPELSRYLKEWAVKYGFSLPQVRSELDRWASDVENRGDDKYALGLAEFYRENFGKAGDLFIQSAEDEEAEYQALIEQEEAIKAKKEPLKKK